MATTVANEAGSGDQETGRPALADASTLDTLADASADSADGNPDNNSHCKTLYDVEHLATFSSSTSSHENTTSKQQQDEESQNSSTPSQNTNAKVSQKDCRTGMDITEPRVALQKLFELEKLSGIWTQRMQIEFQPDLMLVVDCETNSIVERFRKDQVTKPEAFNQYNDIYNNIIAFTIGHSKIEAQKSEQCDRKETDKISIGATNLPDQNNQGSELHIFQCVSHQAQQLVRDILAWKRESDIISTGSQQSSARRPTSEGSTAPTRKPDTGKLDNDFDNHQQHPRKKSEQQQQAVQTDSQEPTNEDKEFKSSTLMYNSSSSGSSSGNIQDKMMMKPSTTSNGSSSSKPPVVVTAAAGKSSNGIGGTVPIVNVNVKETVQVFNQIAALREKSSQATTTTSPTRPLSLSEVAASGAPCSSLVASVANQLESAATSGGVGVGAASLSQGAQLYKQRSIRAILTPTSDGLNATPATSGKQYVESRITAATASTNNNNSNQSLSSTSSSAATATGSTSASSASSSSGAAAASSSSKLAKAAALSQPAELVRNGDSEQLRARSKDRHQHSSSTATKPTLPGALSSGDQNNINNINGNMKSSKSRKAPPAPTRNNSPPAGRQQNIEQQLADQVATNESYVSVLNHCFDDIEKFIIRLQQAFAAARELQASQQHKSRRHSQQSVQQQQQQNQKRSSAPNGNSVSSSSAASSSGHSSSSLATHNNNKHHYNNHHQQQQPLPPIPTSASLGQSELAALVQRSHGPVSEDYFEILSKFKLAFNLLAKLKGCIHEPNAPELVHFLFTPLAIIIESARNVSPPVDPTLVGIPYLNQDALDLLSNCCTSKESDLWLSLGVNWTQTIDMSLLKASRLPSSFQPIFSDGWAPVINELELIGLPSSSEAAAVGLLEPSEHYRSGRSAPRLINPNSGGVDAYGDSSLGSSRRPVSGSSRGPPSDQRKRISPADEGSLGLMPDQQQQQHQQRHAGLSSRSTARVAADYRYHSQGALNGEPIFDDEQLDGPQHGYPFNQQQQHSSDDYTELAPQQADQLMLASDPMRMMMMQDFAPPMRHHHHHHHQQQQQQQHLKQRPHQQNAHQTNETKLLMMRQFRSSDQLPSQPGGGASNGQRRHRAGAAAPPLPPSSKAGQYQLPVPEQQRLAANNFHHQHPDETPEARHHYEQAALAYAAEHEAMLQDLGPAQTEWFYLLQARGSLIVRVLFTREANNDKELSVRRGELLEILDDSRKWWKARSIDLQVAHVPHTIVAIMDQYRTLDELLTDSDPNEPMLQHQHQHYLSSSGADLAPSSMSQRQRHHSRPMRDFAPNGQALVAHQQQQQQHHLHQQQLQQMDERRAASKAAAGAFRYF